VALTVGCAVFDDIYIAASDELFCYGRDFEISGSYRNRYLKHCHEIVRKDRRIFLTSTGFDQRTARRKRFPYQFGVGR